MTLEEVKSAHILMLDYPLTSLTVLGLKNTAYSCCLVVEHFVRQKMHYPTYYDYGIILTSPARAPKEAPHDSHHSRKEQTVLKKPEIRNIEGPLGS